VLTQSFVFRDYFFFSILTACAWTGKTACC